MLDWIRYAGFPVAFVARDDLEHLTVPWDDFDALFIGGSTSWKLAAEDYQRALQEINGEQ
jgi:hypothetical protein